MELSLQDCYDSYRQRYDMEHLFRFGKQKLLMTAYSTPDVEQEENWVKLTLLAYVNLWAARNLAVVLPRPWENYLTQNESLKISPSLVQRDFYRIISTWGTIAKSPIIEVILLDVSKGIKKSHELVIKLSGKVKKNPEKN